MYSYIYKRTTIIWLLHLHYHTYPIFIIKNRSVKDQISNQMKRLSKM